MRLSMSVEAMLASLKPGVSSQISVANDDEL
jgi:hypothetical protein